MHVILKLIPGQTIISMGYVWSVNYSISN